VSRLAIAGFAVNAALGLRFCFDRWRQGTRPIVVCFRRTSNTTNVVYRPWGVWWGFPNPPRH